MNWPNQGFSSSLLPPFLPCHNHSVIGDLGLIFFGELYLKSTITG